MISGQDLGIWGMMPERLAVDMNKTVFEGLIPVFDFSVKHVYEMRLFEVLTGGLPLIFKLKYYLTVIVFNMTKITAFIRN